MPTYHFHLRTKEGTVLDPDGTELPNEALARGHARMVAGELMQHREPRTRYWRLDVYDDDGRRCFDLVFATVDPSIRHLTPELRRLVETVCTSAASLFDTIDAFNLTLLQIKATEARSKRAPYLAAINGIAVDANR